MKLLKITIVACLCFTLIGCSGIKVGYMGTYYKDKPGMQRGWWKNVDGVYYGGLRITIPLN